MLLSLGAQMCHLRVDGLKVGVLCTVQSLATGGGCICTYLLVNSPPSNDAIANDGTLHNAATSRHELPICGKAEYRAHESGVNGTIWQLFQYSYAASSA